MRKVVGYVDVDAGIIQVGDPCYTLPNGSRGNTPRVELTQEAYDQLLSLIPKAGALEAAIKEIREKSDAVLEEENRYWDPGVNYSEMIDRLVDHDDVRLKITDEHLASIHEHLPFNPYHPYNWAEPKVTSLSPVPENRDGVVHRWQPVFNPYKDGGDMVGSPHDHAGLVVSSGYGDGSYAVEVEWDDEGEYWAGREPVTFEFDGKTHVSDKGAPPSMFHRIKSVKVIFIGDDEEEGDEDE